MSTPSSFSRATSWRDKSDGYGPPAPTQHVGMESKWATDQTPVRRHARAATVVGAAMVEMEMDDEATLKADWHAAFDSALFGG